MCLTRRPEHYNRTTQDEFPDTGTALMTPIGRLLRIQGATVVAAVMLIASGWTGLNALQVYQWTLPNQYFVPPVSFSADGRYLALGISMGPAYDPCPLPTCEGRLHVFDLRSGTRVVASTAAHARVMSLAFLHHSPQVAAGYADGKVRVWDLRTSQVAAEYSCCNGKWIRALAAAPNDSVLAIGAQSGQIMLWNVASDLGGDRTERGSARSLPGHVYGVSSLVFDRSSTYLISTADDQHVRRWHVGNANTYEFSRAPDKAKAHRGMVKSVTLLNGDRWAVTGAYWEGGTYKDYASSSPPDHILRLWDVDTGRPIRSYPLEFGVRCCLRPLPDGHRVAFLRATGWSEDPVLEIFDFDRGQSERTVRPSMGESFHSMGAHPDGNQFVIAIGDGNFLIWNRGVGRVVAQLVSVDDGWAVLTPDGRMEFSDGFSRWPCRNNVQRACRGGAPANSTPGLLGRVWAPLQ